jgi:hypothetical protein
VAGVRLVCATVVGGGLWSGSRDAPGGALPSGWLTRFPPAWRLQTVLLTGGLGFIGSHTVEALLAKGYAVPPLPLPHWLIYPYGDISPKAMRCPPP